MSQWMVNSHINDLGWVYNYKLDYEWEEEH